MLITPNSTPPIASIDLNLYEENDLLPRSKRTSSQFMRDAVLHMCMAKVITETQGAELFYLIETWEKQHAN